MIKANLIVLFAVLPLPAWAVVDRMPCGPDGCGGGGGVGVFPALVVLIALWVAWQIVPQLLRQKYEKLPGVQRAQVEREVSEREKLRVDLAKTGMARHLDVAERNLYGVDRGMQFEKELERILKHQNSLRRSVGLPLLSMPTPICLNVFFTEEDQQWSAALCFDEKGRMGKLHSFLTRKECIEWAGVNAPDLPIHVYKKNGQLNFIRPPVSNRSKHDVRN